MEPVSKKVSMATMRATITRDTDTESVSWIITTQETYQNEDRQTIIRQVKIALLKGLQTSECKIISRGLNGRPWAARGEAAGRMCLEVTLA